MSLRSSCLAAAVLLATPAAATGDLLAIVVGEDGRVEPRSVAALQPEDLAAAAHLWVWDGDSEPRRVEPARLPAELTPARRMAVVHLPPQVSRGGFELIAAPREMWLEVPEGLLPRWPIPRDRPARLPVESADWTLRVVGKTMASWWEPVGRPLREVAVTIHPAVRREIALVGPDGGAIEDASVSVLLDGGGDRGMVAVLAAEAGRLSLPPLPDVAAVGLVLSAPGTAPAFRSGLPSELPDRWLLAPGGSLEGSVGDDDGEPIGAVDLAVEGWLPDGAPASFRREATSDAAGRWSLDGLPAGKHRLTARRRGFADHALDVEVAPERQRLPPLVLRRAATRAVRILDDLDAPVAGAAVRHGAGRAVETDAEGAAVLAGIAPDEQVEVNVSARGHLASRAVVPAGGDGEPVVVRLRRAASLRGRLVDEGGAPPLGPRLVIESGRARAEHPVAPNGDFEIDLEPERPLTLVLASTAAAELRRVVTTGPPASVLDLGEVVLPRGHAATGRIWSTMTDQPFAGARVWALRTTSAAGDLLAWSQGETVEARSDHDGVFLLSGLPPAGTLLRIDAPGHARGFVRFAAREESAELPADLGEIWLSEGAAVEVVAAEAEPGSVARVYPRGEWSEIDALTAQLVDGAARVERVPAGEVLVAVGEGRNVWCEERRSVADGELAEVSCEDSGVAVSGTVIVGGRPAGPGRLTWRPADRSLPPGVILRDVTAAGAQRQRVYGAGPADREVEVEPSGFFAVERLAPGEWSVSWRPREGYFSPAVSVTVPEADLRDVVLRFAAGAVAGAVHDEAGRPVPGASVRDLDSTAFAVSGDGGEFELTGLGGGRHRLFARLADRRSEELEVHVDPERPTDPVALVLGTADDDQLTVDVRDPEGAPASAALVLLDLGGGHGRLVTADGLGRAAVTLDPPWPASVTVAAYHAGRWAFARSSVSPAEPLEVTIGDTGELLVRAAEAVAAPALLAADGRDIGEALLRVGLPLRVDPDQPSLVAGLPTGRYRLVWEGRQVDFEIRGDERTEVEVP